MPRRSVLVCGEEPAQRRPHPEHVEIVAAHQVGPDDGALAMSRDGQRDPAPGRAAGERPGAVAKVACETRMSLAPLRCRRGAPAGSSPPARLCDTGQRPKHGRVHRAEDRGDGAAAQAITITITSVKIGLLRSMRPAKRMSVDEGRDDVLPAVIAHLLADAHGRAHVAPRGAARLGRGESPLDVRLGRLLEVVAQLLIELVVCLSRGG